ncbi:MAG: signal peptidase I [Bacilli bacterium]
MNIKKTVTYITISILILIFTINFGFAKVDGDSMKPKLNNNNILIYTKTKKSIERFDMIIVKVKKNIMVKRVIGLPGEKITYLNNKLYINGKVVNEPYLNSVTNDFDLSTIISNDIIPHNKIFILGDNRLYSTDSRTFGLVDVSDIKGKIIKKIF